MQGWPDSEPWLVADVCSPGAPFRAFLLGGVLCFGCGSTSEPEKEAARGGSAGAPAPAGASGSSMGGAGASPGVGGATPTSGAGAAAGAEATAGSTSVGGAGGAVDSDGNAGSTAAGTAGSSSAGATGSPSDGGTGGEAPETDPAPGEYGKRANLQVANSEMAVAEVNGKIYVLGGYPSSRVTQSTVQVYDPETDVWGYVAELPIPIHHPVAVGVDGKLYSLGGQTHDGDTARTLVYDPVADSWDDLAPMPTARGAGAGAVIGDVIYVIAGRPPSAGNAFEAYDIGEDRWTQLPDLPQTFPDRNHIAAAAIGGKIYVAGGRYDSGSFSGPMTDSLDVYDPATMQWTTGASMLRQRGGVNGVAANGCFFVWGGEGTNTGEPNDVFPDMDVYDPVANRWTALAPLPTPVHGVTGAAFVDGVIYIPGGGTRSGGTSGSTIFQVYRPNVSCP